MTITTLIINIAFILGISLAFILGRKSVMKKAKKLKKKAKKTKNVKDKVTDGKKAKRSQTGSNGFAKTQKKHVIDLDPNNYIQNLAKEALETSKDIKEMTEAK